MKYTVLLMLPDYVAQPYGEVAQYHVEAETTFEAVLLAQGRCLAECASNRGLDSYTANDCHDFAPVAVYQGEHENKVSEHFAGLNAASWVECPRCHGDGEEPGAPDFGLGKPLCMECSGQGKVRRNNTVEEGNPT